MEDRTESPSSAKVRDLIFAYESQSNVAEPLEDHYGRPRAKSIGNALSYKHFRKPVLEFHNIMDIEKELVKIEAHLNYYEIYDKETHVAFQEQLFSVLTSIVSIDPEDLEEAVKLKKKLIQETQKLAKILNSKLPYDISHSYKGIRRTYSTMMRKEDAVVSTTSVRHQEHRALFSGHNVTLNGGFRSEESLNSTRESVDTSLRHDESSVDLNHTEDLAQSNTPPPQSKLAEEAHSTIIPSVSKLKKFFSFRREAKPETKVISASNSGISRSQSLNIKTSKHTITKRGKNVDSRLKENVICENDENIDNNHNLQENLSFVSQNQNANHSISTTYQENTSTIQEHPESENNADGYKETQNETLNVSVSKLKSLFETNKTETNEGLGLLIKKPNDFVTDFNLPFTAMNLGSYRLKRTISGNYMNFTGLLRNVDINKRSDLSKSKSLSDLKSTNLSYTSKEFDIDDLSNEIDDADDFVSIDASRNTKEINNNVVTEYKERSEKGFITETGETVRHDNEVIVSSASVESLKQTFENLSNGSTSTYKESGGEIRHIITTGTNKGPVINVSVEQKTVLTGSQDHSKTVTENSISNSATVYKENTSEVNHVITKATAGTTKGPLIKVPVQSGEHTSRYEKFTGTEENSGEGKHVIAKLTNGFNKGPMIRVPAQLRTGYTSTVQHSKTTEAGYQAKTASSQKKDNTLQATHKENQVHSQEVSVKVPQVPQVIDISQKESAAVTKHIIDNKSDYDTAKTVSSTGTVESIKQTVGTMNTEDFNTIYRTIEPIPGANESDEPILKIPIQLRVGGSNFNDNKDNLEEYEKVDATEEITQETVETTSAGTVDTLRQTFESMGSLSTTDDSNTSPYKIIQPIPGVEGTEEPVLKVPIQLRVGISNFSEEEINDNEEILTHDPQVEEHVSKISIQQRLGENTSEKETVKFSGKRTITISEQRKQVPIVDVTDYNDGTDHSILLSEGKMSREKISAKTDTFMKLLESPRTFSSIVSSSSSQGQVSSSSNIATSYSEKQTVQHSSSTHVSQRITSSSSSSSSFSSQLSSQNYLQIIKEPISYSSLSINNPENEDVSVIVTEPDEENERKSKINLNISQENILEEILNETDSLENIDEEFERIIEKK